MNIIKWARTATPGQIFTDLHKRMYVSQLKPPNKRLIEQRHRALEIIVNRANAEKEPKSIHTMLEVLGLLDQFAFGRLPNARRGDVQRMHDALVELLPAVHHIWVGKKNG